VRKALVLVGALICVLGGIPAPAIAAPLTVEIAVEPTRVEIVLGDRFTITTEVRNTGGVDSGPLLAHLNVASLAPDVYVDPEDWSSARSQELSLQPGESRTLSWELQAVNSGRFGAYVVILPASEAVVEPRSPVVTPLATLDVAPRSTLNAGGVLPVVLGVPLLLGLTAAAARFRMRPTTGRIPDPDHRPAVAEDD